MSISPVASEPAPVGPAWQRVPRDRSGATARTTLALELELLTAIDREVLRGGARGRSDFINVAILAELRRRERDAVDAAFRSMAGDSTYLAEMRQIDAEFASADAEAWDEFETDLGPPSE